MNNKTSYKIVVNFLDVLHMLGVKCIWDEDHDETHVPPFLERLNQPTET